MGSLREDTALTAVGDDAYEAVLSEDWNIWGPNGGYLAAVALRAAGAATSVASARPASLQCHFLGVASFAPVRLDVTVLRSARRAEALRVSMTQGGAPVLDAQVWVVADGLEGLAHEGASMPEVPHWSTLTPLAELIPPDYTRHRFAQNLDERMLEDFVPFDQRPATAPEYGAWIRFRAEPVFEDPFVDGGRLCVLVDTFQWPAAARGHDGATLSYVAPSLDLTCQLHRDASAWEWLLVEAVSPVAAGGLVAGSCRVWNEEGGLVASGSQVMLCRPMREADRPK